MGVKKVRANNTIGELFHDQATEYISTIEPTKEETVTVRLRAEKGNLTSAYLNYTKDGSNTEFIEVQMEYIGLDNTGYYEYWEAEIPAHNNTYYYSFKALNDSGSVYYGARGKMESKPYYTNCFQLIPGFSTPDWAKGANWYFINPDGFYNGDVHNDASDTETQKGVAWGSSLTGLMERYGGDLNGISKKIDYLNTLNIDAVYLNPIWESRQNMGYGPLSYYKISSNLGNDADLIALSEQLHKNDMKLALDAIFSYSMKDGIWLNKNEMYPLDGAYQDTESIYKDMFTWNSATGDYEIVWNQPRVDLSSNMAKELFYQAEDSVLQRYLKAPYNIDSWRFDAVNSYYAGEQSSQDIALEIREAAKAINRETLLICEDNTSDNLSGGGWDTAYGIRGYFRRWFSGEYTQTEFANNLQDYLCRTRSAALCTLNLYDLHDEARISNDTEADAAKLRALTICQMTFLGSPCTYYGDEVGVENNIEKGFGAQKYNSFNWNEDEWDMSLYRLHCALGELRKEYSALKTGVIGYEVIDEEKKLMCFGRYDGDGAVIAITNQTDNVYEQRIDVKQYNVCDGAILTDYLTGEKYVVENGHITVNVYAGGNVLVTGNAAGDYKDVYAISKASNVAKCYYEDFTGGTLKEFAFEGETISLSDGYCTITAQTPVTLLESAPQSDYTIKCKMSAVTGTSYAPVGAVSYVDADNFVFAGRIKLEGQNYLALGEFLNGNLIVHAKVSDLSSKDNCIVQLQKIGANFSAVYSYNGSEWNVIGRDLKCNYSVQKAGLYVGEDASVAIDYVSFGDAFSDETTICTPCYPETIDVSFATNTENIGLVKVAIVDEEQKEEWQYVNGGIARVEGTGISQLAIRNRLFRNFRTLVTLKPDEGSKCGVTLLRSSYDSTLGQAYVLELVYNGTIQLRYGGDILVNTAVTIPETGLAIAIERVDDNMRIFVGEERTLIANIEDVAIERGYITYYVDGTGGIFNDSTHALTQAWTDILGAYAASFKQSGNSIISNSGNLAFDHISAVGFTDVSFEATVTVVQVDESAEAYSGIIIGAKERAVPQQSDGYVLGLFQDGLVKLVNNGEVLAESEQSYEGSVSLELMQKDNSIYAYVDGQYCEELSLSVDNFNGGVVGIVSNNSTGTFSDISLMDITNEETNEIATPNYCTVTLNGKIEVNFYMNVREGFSQEAYMSFELPNSAEPINVPISQAENTVVGYKFSCAVAAKEMTDTIRAQFIDGDEASDIYTYSVKEYADYIIENPTRYDEKAVHLVKCMLNYGAHSQLYFDYRIDDLANQNLSDEDKKLYESVTKETLAGYAKPSYENDAIGKLKQVSLVLKSTTELKMYFDFVENDDTEIVVPMSNDTIPNLRILCDGEEITPKKSGQYHVVTIENIAADKLDKDYVVTISNGIEKLEVTYNAMTYCYNVLCDTNHIYATEELQKLVACMYQYNCAAKEYINIE